MRTALAAVSLGIAVGTASPTVSAQLGPADISVATKSAPTTGQAGIDAQFVFTVANNGPFDASGVTLTVSLQGDVLPVWASPGCAHAAGTVYCAIADGGRHTLAEIRIVVRPLSATVFGVEAEASANEVDPAPVNNATTYVTIASLPSPAAIRPIQRFHHPASGGHFFTTRDDEAATLVASGAWQPEGIIGFALSNGARPYNGVMPVPNYRLFDAFTGFHLWTIDANEYYSLTQHSRWRAEGVDGYLLPNITSNSGPRYRLHYPHGPVMHHYTGNPQEWQHLTTLYGWASEGVDGFFVYP